MPAAGPVAMPTRAPTGRPRAVGRAPRWVWRARRVPGLGSDTSRSRRPWPNYSPPVPTPAGRSARHRPVRTQAAGSLRGPRPAERRSARGRGARRPSRDGPAQPVAGWARPVAGWACPAAGWARPARASTARHATSHLPERSATNDRRPGPHPADPSSRARQVPDPLPTAPDGPRRLAGPAHMDPDNRGCPAHLPPAPDTRRPARSSWRGDAAPPTARTGWRPAPDSCRPAPNG